MSYLKEMDWKLIWSIIKDTILPHSGRLILSVVLFIILGFFLALIYTIFLSKKRILKRKPKYYNWAVKLYIPIFFIAFLYVFGQIGFLRGVNIILIKEKENIISGVYNKSMNAAFNSEESKNEFIKEIQITAKDFKDGSNEFATHLKQKTLAYNSGYALIDKSKNKISNYLIEKYGDDIYTTSLYGMLALGGAKVHADITETLPYSEFSAAMDFLLNVGYKDIELSIKEKLSDWFALLVDSQYRSMRNSLFILLLAICIVPFIEYFIYKKWIEPNYVKNNLVTKSID